MTTPKPAPQPRAPRRTDAPGSPLGFEELKTLIALVSKEAFQEFEFEAGNMRFRIRRDSEGQTPEAPPAARPPARMPTQTLVASATPAEDVEPAEDPGIHYITSPIVGTFYRSSGPSSGPFVQVDDRVKPGQILCIVEAMKLMNEIECDMAGEVVKVLVENGQPVEYGERLFAIRVR
jgi:acetyl-CoA carboxylase biotin carboxyl carrier protein